MALDNKTVAKVARLARLKMTDDELAKYGPQLNNIMGMIDQLSEVNTDNVEPLASPVQIALKQREDVVNDGGIQDDVLANAPETLEGFYVVPKIVE